MVETLRTWPMSINAATEAHAAAHAERPNLAAFRARRLDWYRQQDPACDLGRVLMFEEQRTARTP